MLSFRKIQMSIKSNLAGIIFAAGILGGGWGGANFLENLQNENLYKQTAKIQEYNSLVEKIDSASEDKNPGLDTELLRLVEEKSISESDPEVQAYKDFGSDKYLGLLEFVLGLTFALGSVYCLIKYDLNK